MPDKPISRKIAPSAADSRGDCAGRGPHARGGEPNRNQLVTAIVSNSSTANWGADMDKNEDSKAPSQPETAGDPANPAATPPARPAAASEPAVESKSELA